MKFHSRIYGWDYVWRDFADETGAALETEEVKGKESIVAVKVPMPGGQKMIFSPKVRKGKKWQVGTTAALNYKPTGDFLIAVHDERGRDKFGKLMGLQDLEVGDEVFDRRFIVQATDKAVLLDIMEDVEIRDILLDQPQLFLRIIHDKSEFAPEWEVPEGQSVIAYMQDTIVEDFEHLKVISRLLFKVHYQLAASGAAQSDEVQPREATKNRSGLFTLK